MRFLYRDWTSIMVSAMVCCVFFFKQKTAYELRISDWSSDVCSSDLRCKAADHHGRDRQRQVPEIIADLQQEVHAAAQVQPQVHGLGLEPAQRAHPGRSEERRVGKSVSVSVDPGGRRFIKKNK